MNYFFTPGCDLPVSKLKQNTEAAKESPSNYCFCCAISVTQINGAFLILQSWNQMWNKVTYEMPLKNYFYFYNSSVKDRNLNANTITGWQKYFITLIVDEK